MNRSPVGRLAILFSAAALAGLVAACSGVSADWVKKGASEEQVRRDNATCRAEAEDAYGQTANITHDIDAARSRSLTNVQARSEEIRSSRTRSNYDKVFDTCMAAHGYSRKTDE